jgi:hypothetical protein
LALTALIIAIAAFGPYTGMTATNTGLVPVTVTSTRLEIKDRNEALFPVDWVHQEPTLPARVEPGSRWLGLVDVGGVEASLRDSTGGRPGPWQVRPAVSDSADRTHRAGGRFGRG